MKIYNFINESFILSYDDEKYDFDKWKNGDLPFLFVIGYSRSGKSTISRELSDNTGAKHISLDRYLMDSAKENNRNIVTLEAKEWKELFKESMINLFQELDSSKKEKIIIEGIQIPDLLVFDWGIPIAKNFIENGAFIIKGTSYITSSYRVIIKNWQLGGPSERTMAAIYGRFMTNYNFSNSLKKFKMFINKIKGNV